MIQPNLATLTELCLGSGSASKGKCESNGYPTGHADWGWAHGPAKTHGRLPAIIRGSARLYKGASLT